MVWYADQNKLLRPIRGTSGAILICVPTLIGPFIGDNSMVNKCLICGKEFYIRPSRVKKGWGKYCSRKCFYLSDAYLVARRITLTKPRIIIICEYCGKEFKRLPSEIKRGQQFCSKKCKHKTMPTGHDAYNWRGGRSIIKSNNRKYYMMYAPSHPANVNGRVFEHRLIMEKHIGRYLTDKEVVHHINFDGLDNRIENLMLFANNGKHLSYEFANKRSDKSRQGSSVCLLNS